MEGRKLTREIRVVNLSVPQPGIVQNLQLLSIRLGDVRVILVVIFVHLLRVRQALLVAEMVPIRRRECKLDVPPLALRDKRLHIFKLVDVAALARMADLAIADDRLAGNMFLLEERGDVWRVRAENVGVRPVHLLHAVQ